MRQLNFLVLAVLICGLVASVPFAAEKAEKKTPKASQKESNDGEKSADKQGMKSLAGTIWHVIYQNNQNFQTDFEFQKDGVFACRGDTGTWKLDGTTLRIKTKTGAEFEGTYDGKTMSGKVRAVKGERSAEYSWKGTRETPKVP